MEKFQRLSKSKSNRSLIGSKLALNLKTLRLPCRSKTSLLKLEMFQNKVMKRQREIIFSPRTKLTSKFGGLVCQTTEKLRTTMKKILSRIKKKH
jgi:hypothetical protein